MPTPVSTQQSARAPLVGILIVALALAVALFAWWRARSPASDTASADDRLAREMVAAYYGRDMRAEAREALRPLVERARPAVQDLVHAAIIEMSVGDFEAAQTYLRRAERFAPNDPAVHFNFGHIFRVDGDFVQAQQRFERVLERAPDDLPTRYVLATIVEEDDPERARQLYQSILDYGVDVANTWYVAALFRMGMMARETDAGMRLLEEYSRLIADNKLEAPQEMQVQLGNLGRIAPPAPSGNAPRGPSALPSLSPPVVIAADFDAHGLLQSDADNNGLQDVVAWGPGGLLVARQAAGFAWSSERLESAAVDSAIAFDLGNDDDLDFVYASLYASGGELRLLQADDTPEGIRWSRVEKGLPALDSAPQALLALDFDHEGDLDLLIVGAFGVRLLRNDGAAVTVGGVFTDVTVEAGLPAQRAFQWALSEDFDVDQDVDLLLGGPGGMFLASNLRGGKFVDLSANVQPIGAPAARPLAADLDGDGLPDLWSHGVLWRNQPSGAFRRADSAAAEVPQAARLHSADLDLDGSLDIFWLDGTQLRGFLSAGLAAQAPFTLPLEGAQEPRDIVTADLDALADGHLAHDVLTAGPGGIAVHRGSAPANKAARLGFRGVRDNRRGIGAVVAVRAGPIYRRIYWRGEPELVGVGQGEAIDYVRITWPNGVVQWDLRRELGDRAVTDDALGLLQIEGQAGSCPFLYTWNGERFEFISDVLGITPLGLPMAPGMLVPPDHDEFVLIRGEQLAARDNVFEMHVTEELREVTYLDRVRLDVVDHPAGTRVYPNELFTFPPFPEHKIHVIGTALPPARATGSDGKDWTQALASIDDQHAVPFQPAPGQFAGLANPHFLELEYERERVASAPRLRLVLTGWFYWTNASVNMASARDPSQEFIPPLLQVPDGKGGWRDTGPPIGFPAGKTKTMVIDVTDLLVREDPRVRLFSTLRLYWDAIELAIDAGDGEVQVHSLEPAAANLWRRGFSAPLATGRDDLPERFVWEQLSELPRWNPHPGMYTRMGDVLPLLDSIDDRFVIFGAGEAVTLRFDAAELPPQRKESRRDYLLFLDGWAKDRDHNTLEAERVEPLPFHGMSGYPYGPGERFPDDEIHRRWRAEWNTRPGEPWIEFLPSPGAPNGSLPGIAPLLPQSGD